MSAERPLTILLVEDDPHSCQELAEAIDLTEDAVLTGVTAHADQAVTLIQDYIPDCLILDLELHAGSGNGFHVLQSMKRLDLPRPPYVVITTNNSSVVTHEAARNLGADFIFTKHQTDYSAKNVIEFLCMIKSVIQSRSNHISAESMPAETPHMREKRLIRRIHAELDAVGISPKAIGRQYLTDAILLVIDKPERNLPAAIGKNMESLTAASNAPCKMLFPEPGGPQISIHCTETIPQKFIRIREFQRLRNLSVIMLIS